MSNPLPEIRCEKCGKLLMKGALSVGHIEIVCTKGHKTVMIRTGKENERRFNVHSVRAAMVHSTLG